MMTFVVSNRDVAAVCGAVMQGGHDDDGDWSFLFYSVDKYAPEIPRR
jgi:hypothetical protein